jgi:hypothetical protein
MVYGTYNYSYWGESKPTYNWGGHIVSLPKLLPLEFTSENPHMVSVSADSIDLRSSMVLEYLPLSPTILYKTRGK